MLKKRFTLPLALFCCALMLSFAMQANRRANDGFTLSNISSNLEPSPVWNTTAPDSIVQSEVEEALKQPFHYIGRGKQCYAFASHDDKYVIKFFRQQHLRINNFLRMLPLPRAFEGGESKSAKPKRKNSTTLLRAIKLLMKSFLR